MTSKLLSIMNNITGILIITVMLSFVVIGGAGLISPKDTTTTPQSNGDLNNALAEAKNTNKYVFIDFYADWCTYCRQMEENTYTDPQVQQKISQNYVFVKIDTNNNPEVSSNYKVYGLPTIIILNSNGQEVKRIEGYQSPTQLLSQI
jgi:thiol:disulfide interchange protein DsbD